MNATIAKTAAAALIAAASFAAPAAHAANGSVDITLQTAGKDVCSGLGTMTTNGMTPANTYIFQTDADSTLADTAAGRTANVALYSDATGGKIVCTGNGEKYVYIKSANGGLVPKNGETVPSGFLEKITYDVDTVKWGSATPFSGTASSETMVSSPATFKKPGAANGSVTMNVTLDASSVPLIGVTYEDVMTITVSDAAMTFSAP